MTAVRSRSRFMTCSSTASNAFACAALLFCRRQTQSQADFIPWANQGTRTGTAARAALLRRGLRLEYATLAWNVLAMTVLPLAAASARSIALAGFGLDSLIEIGASAVVVWELSDRHHRRRAAALKAIGVGFALLALCLGAQSTWALATGFRAGHSALGIGWTALTALAMFALAIAKERTGEALDHPVLRAEGCVTLVDGLLAAAVLTGLLLNSLLGWWWADPAAGYILVYYAVREAWHIRTAHP